MLKVISSIKKFLPRSQPVHFVYIWATRINPMRSFFSRLFLACALVFCIASPVLAEDPPQKFEAVLTDKAFENAQECSKQSKPGQKASCNWLSDECEPIQEKMGSCPIGVGFSPPACCRNLLTTDSAAAAAKEAGATEFKPIIPNLNVSIPGLNFGTPTLDGAQKAKIPYLAQYIAAVYKYLTGVAVIAAAVMLTWGGFLYISGETTGKISEAKDIIQDALIGLFLVIGAFTILGTINYNLVGTLKTVNVQIVLKEQVNLKTIDVKKYKEIISTAPSENPGGELTPPPATPGEPPPPEGTPPPASSGEGCTFAMNSLGIPTKQSIYQCAIKLSNDAGLHPCFAVVALNNESWDGLPNAIGYDENAGFLGTYPNFQPVGARRAFLRGRRYSHPKNGSSSFPASMEEFPSKCISREFGKNGTDELNDDEVAQVKKCIDISKRQSSEWLNNDDTGLDPARDDLGLDWSYSRGIGLTQATIFGKSQWCAGGVPSLKITRKGNTSCYTVKQLFNPYENLKAGISILQGCGAKPNSNYGAVWGCYAGGQSDNSSGRAGATAACIQRFGQNPLGAMKGATICRGDLPLSRTACRAKVAEIQAANAALPKEQKDQAQSLPQCEIGCFDSRYPIKQSQITK